MNSSLTGSVGSWRVTFIEVSGGTTKSLHVASNQADFLTTNVKRLKEIVLEEWPKYENTDAIRLLYGAKQLDEIMTLSDYGIKRNSTLHIVLRVCGGTTAERVRCSFITSKWKRHYIDGFVVVNVESCIHSQ